jgi:GTP diphosphokinase / guanosine-3',5'-bis(diphosphate) 3'-diphosphatase
MLNLAKTRLLIDALAFAADKHRKQRRKDPEASPYINHPITLAQVLAKEARITNPTVLAAAILHDTIEDTETTYEELRDRFGKKIAGIVREVSDDKTLSKVDRKRLQIEHAKDLSRAARLVKLADKISNVRDIASNPPAHWHLERRREYFDWAKKVVDRIRGTNKKLERAFDEAYLGRP